MKDLFQDIYLVDNLGKLQLNIPCGIENATPIKTDQNLFPTAYRNPIFFEIFFEQLLLLVYLMIVNF